MRKGRAEGGRTVSGLNLCTNTRSRRGTTLLMLLNVACAAYPFPTRQSYPPQPNSTTRTIILVLKVVVEKNKHLEPSRVQFLSRSRSGLPLPFFPDVTSPPTLSIPSISPRSHSFRGEKSHLPQKVLLCRILRHHPPHPELFNECLIIGKTVTTKD